MPGLSLQSSIATRLTSGQTDEPPNYGQAQVFDSSPVTVSTAAFGPSASVPPPSGWAMLHPRTPTGAALWSGVLALGLLIVIRQSLPA